MFSIRILFSPLRLIFYIFSKLLNLLGKKEILSHSIPERFTMLSHNTWFSFLFPKIENSFVEYLSFLSLVEQSKEIKKLVYKVPEMEASWEQLERIASALRAIARSGKKLVAYTHGGNLKSLYLMALAKERIASPHANFVILLPDFESYFIREALDNLGIRVETQSAGSYKGAGFESFTHKSFSPQSRQSMSTLLHGLRQELQGCFEKTPGLNKAGQNKTLSLLKNNALIQARDLVKTSFLHRTLPTSSFLEGLLLGKKFSPLFETAHVFTDANAKRETKKKRRERILRIFNRALEVRNKAADDAAFLRRWKRRKYPLFRLRSLPSLAFVAMEGPISMGSSQDLPRSSGIDALPFASLFQNLLKSDEEAVFLYINSPGGSADASEILYESIYQLSRIKPVFAFLGSVAASGGYYIACAANRIYASPLSITGSIGVIRIRPDLRKLYHKLGVRKETLLEDPTREIFSETAVISSEGRALLEQTLQSTYQLFLQRVSEGREKESKEVFKMSEGRVFTGRQFQEEGMLDEYFSFIEALRVYKQASGIPEKREYQLQYYPELRLNLKDILGAHSKNRKGLGAGYSVSPSASIMAIKEGLEQICKGNTGLPLFYFAWERGLRNL